MVSTPALLLGGLAALALFALWIAATRRHRRRREAALSEWDDSEAHGGLWTSGARCPSCGRRGGLLQRDGDHVEFVCLGCGHRHLRRERA